MRKSIDKLTKVVTLCGLWGLAANHCVVGFSQVPSQASPTVASSNAPPQPVEVQPVEEQPVEEQAGNAQQAEEVNIASDEVTAKVENARKPSAGRLPPYFASLVDSRQRDVIYKIRASMAAKIAELEKQLEELRQAEMHEIEGVLTDDQRQQLQSLRAIRAAKKHTSAAPS